MNRWASCWAWACAALFALDRLWKLAAVLHFFRRPPPAPPPAWPSVTLIQPITRGVRDLAHNLGTRLALDYPAPIQHLWVCDAADHASQRICRELLARAATAAPQIVLVEADGEIAGKIEKMLAALPLARGQVLVFVDDDVALRPQALRILLPYLNAPQAGAAFGLACYTNWRSVWSSAMSAFVNANALLSYIPLVYLTEPFTITGHCFALYKAQFDAVGGLGGLAGRLDDDHELARRVRRRGLRCIQTPMIYDVDNDLPTLGAYLAQMQRWFVFPRRLMLPYLTRYEQLVSALGSLGNLLPSLALIPALGGRRGGWRAPLAMLAGFVALYLFGERRYLGRATPLKRLLVLPIVAFVAPLQALWALCAGDRVRWRGRYIRIGRDGMTEDL